MAKKVMITCAVTGAIHTPSMSPHLPITPQQVATAAIEALPLIRNVLGKEFPLLFDSGVRGGSDIIRALALGADYVMLGRPLMYGIGADGEKGLRRILDIIKDELSTALGLVGLTDINHVSSEIIAKKFIQNMKY